MVRRAPARTRGFTLIELMVASAVALVTLAAALSLLVAGSRAHRRHVELGELKRSAALVMDQLSAELRQAGLGLPTSCRAELGGEPFPPAILSGDTDTIVFAADVPRPDSSFNGLSSLAGDQGTGSPNSLAVLNELNGGCDVYLSPSGCSTGTANLLFPPDPSAGCEGSARARTCPWGLNRYRAHEYVLIVGGTGKWVERQLDGALAVTRNSRRSLALTTPAPVLLFDGPNRGFLSTPDRLFYRQRGSVVERKQCWGSVGAPATATGLSTPCAPGTDGTDWEPLASGVVPSGLVFTYFDADDNTLIPPLDASALPRVRRVELRLHLQHLLGSSPVDYDDFTSVSLRQ